VHSESVWGAHDAGLASCRVLSHDAAGFVCRRADRAASSRVGRAGADRSDSARHRDFPGAVGQSGEPGRRPGDAGIDPGQSVCSDPRESAGRNGHVNDAVHSGEPAGIESRPREPVHAPGDNDADGGD
jgi:hypothetical protein